MSDGGGGHGFVAGQPQLGLVVERLLEVVADDLVQLDQVARRAAQPVGEPLVQVGPGCLGQGVVGGVADQQVAEAERVLAGDNGAFGADQLLRTSAASRGVTVVSSGVSA